MAILKIIQGEYVNPDALDRLIHGYIFPYAIRIGGVGVNPQYAAMQMHITKQNWNQEGGKQLRHFVVSYSKRESDRFYSVEEVAIAAYMICGYYYDGGYQSVFGIHRPSGCDHWHVHFAVNNVNFMTGERLPESKRLDYELKCRVLGNFKAPDRVAIYYD